MVPASTTALISGPYSPGRSFMASRAMPMATPAWGTSVRPSQRTMVCSQRSIFAPSVAPRTFPATRKMTYTTPTRLAVARTEKSRPAPERTKKSMNSGGVKRSETSSMASLLS